MILFAQTDGPRMSGSFTRPPDAAFALRNRTTLPCALRSFCGQVYEREFFYPDLNDFVWPARLLA